MALSTPTETPGTSGLKNRRRRAIFVDRDGTLNPDVHYLADSERVEIIAGVSEGIRWFQQHGFLVICVTNQSGIERGLYSAEDVEAIHRRLNARLAAEGARIDAYYYCPHAPETGCSCRKPGTLLFERARTVWNLDFPTSAIVGDRAPDMEVGGKLGLLSAFVPERGSPPGEEKELARLGLTPEVAAESFLGAASRILARG
jgi:D-glycero-D-manno-heptose 1,7-bisphosphate phosphatase